MKITDLFTAEQFQEALVEGWLSAREHPSEPLVILNYTDRVTYARAWNDCTLNCRGLIYRKETLEIVARPFRKFFNHGEPSAPVLDLNEPVHVTDKMDGSLGILYPTSDGWAVATRGSFVSEQAVKATEMLRARYGGWYPPEGWTVLTEIVYPANRIVLDYGGLEAMVLLGAIEIATGNSVGPMHPLLYDWPSHRTATFPFNSLAEALAAEPRKNAEGLVVHCLTSGERVKLKQEDYVRLHRIVTGLNERTVWEHLKAGGTLNALLEPLPEEFHDWTCDVVGRLHAEVMVLRSQIVEEYTQIVRSLPEGYTKKDFALVAVQSGLASFLFAHYIGKDYTDAIWDRIRPAPFLAPRGAAMSEDSR